MLLPTRCPVCGEASRGAPCRRCLGRLRRAPEAPPPEGLAACRSLLVYEGAGRRLVTGLKYRNDRAALTWLAGRMAELLVPPPGAVVAWPPTSAARRRRRGFDQAELLARAVARRWGLPCRPLLVRAAADGAPQTGASAAARAAGPALRPAAPAAVGRTAVAGRTVVVVDDVTTTGATLRAASEALRAAGATKVLAITAARTPRRSVPPHAQTVWERRDCLPSVRHLSRAVDESLKLPSETAEVAQ